MRRKLQKLALGLTALVVVLSLSLTYHIHQVRAAKPDQPTLQISCIDVQRNLTPAQVKWMHRLLKSCPGWVSDHYSEANHRWVFFHDNRQSSARDIYQRLQQRTPWAMTLLQVSPELAHKKVCPAMADVDLF